MLKIILFTGGPLFATCYEPNQSEVSARVVLANGSVQHVDKSNVRCIHVADPDEYSSLN